MLFRSYVPQGEWRRKKAFLNSSGYLKVKLTNAFGEKKGIEVHRLICEAFHGPCPNGLVARHFPDGRKTNNRADNLQWGTHKQNAHDRTIHGNTRAKLGISDVREIRARLRDGENSQILAREFGVSCCAVYAIKAGRAWANVA